MNSIRNLARTHGRLYWGILLVYIAFNGCFMFPISDPMFPIDLQKGYILLVGYGIIGIMFAGAFEKGKSHFVFLITLAFTAIGLISRYFLEYGEVSNERNFTLRSIVLFLVVIPTYCMIVYCVVSKVLEKIGKDLTN